VVKYVSNQRLDTLLSSRLKARVSAAADSIINGSLIAAPRPRSMEASSPGLTGTPLARLGT
jgi:hypothetical protein